MALDTIADNLIVMHSSDGIFKVDLKSGEKIQLVSESDVIGIDVRFDSQLKFEIFDINHL